jgi:creatinine deaminase
VLLGVLGAAWTAFPPHLVPQPTGADGPGGRGHNRRVQLGNPILHGETDCLQNVGRIGSFKGTTMYSTLMPCYMCSGTIVQFRIMRVVVGEALSFPGGRQFMEAHGVEVVDLEMPECSQMMQAFIEANPELWAEDIGEL